MDCGGPTCPKCAAGKVCVSGADCVSALCQGGVCQAIAQPTTIQPTTVPPSAPTCVDSVKNAQETDVDCGGPTCPKCVETRQCLVASDCVAGLFCVGYVCRSQQALCSNGEPDLIVETDVDCGGLCAFCDDGKRCVTGSDCKSLNCVGGICQALPTCTDGRKNGVESDVDCGGPACPRCVSSKRCVVGTDCSSGVCTDGLCQDTVRESVKCLFMDAITGQPASTSQDCYSEKGTCKGIGACVVADISGKNGEQVTWKSSCGGYAYTTMDGANKYAEFKCTPLPTCTDGVKNGQESDVDCGSPTCPKCGLSKTCSSGADCLTAKCQNNLCCVADVGSPCARNACGSYGGTTRCDGSCSGSTPALPPGVDSQCRCIGTDTNQDGYRCGGTCAYQCQSGRLCDSDKDCLNAVDYRSGDGGTMCMVNPIYRDEKKRCISCGTVRTTQKWGPINRDAQRGAFTETYLFNYVPMMIPPGASFAIIDGVTIGQVLMRNSGPGQCLWFALRQAGTGNIVALQGPPVHTEDYTFSNAADIQNRRNKVATGVLLQGAHYGIGVNCPTSIQDFTLKYRACG